MKSIFASDGTYTEHYKRMHWNKYWYRTEAEAKSSARSQMMSMKVHKPVFRAYKCDYCDGWHLTSDKPDIKLYLKGSRRQCRKPHRTLQAVEQASRATNRSWFICSRCGEFHLEG